MKHISSRGIESFDENFLQNGKIYQNQMSKGKKIEIEVKFFHKIMLMDEKNKINQAKKNKDKEMNVEKLSNRTEKCHAESMKKLAKLRFHMENIVKHLRTSVEVPSTNTTITEPGAQDESDETKSQDEEEVIKQSWFGWLRGK